MGFRPFRLRLLRPQDCRQFHGLFRFPLPSILARRQDREALPPIAPARRRNTSSSVQGSGSGKRSQHVAGAYSRKRRWDCRQLVHGQHCLRLADLGGGGERSRCYSGAIVSILVLVACDVFYLRRGLAHCVSGHLFDSESQSPIFEPGRGRYPRKRSRGCSFGGLWYKPASSSSTHNSLRGLRPRGLLEGARGLGHRAAHGDWDTVQRTGIGTPCSARVLGLFQGGEPCEHGKELYSVHST
jgi:hypothetical protein